MLTIERLRRLSLGPLDLTLEAGDCVALTGPSGAGKSLLLRAIADLDPHEGEASLDGARCSAMPAPAWRSRVTYVAAEAGWWAEGVGEHFADAAAAAPLLPRLGLAAAALGWQVNRLSTGERQRLALLRALVQKPRVLLLDEPTSALDRDATAQVEALLRDQLAAAMAVLLVTHDPAQAERLARRRLILADGRITESRA